MYSKVSDIGTARYETSVYQSIRHIICTCIICTARYLTYEQQGIRHMDSKVPDICFLVLRQKLCTWKVSQVSPLLMGFPWSSRVGKGGVRASSTLDDTRYCPSLHNPCVFLFRAPANDVDMAGLRAAECGGPQVHVVLPDWAHTEVWEPEGGRWLIFL